MNLNMSDGNSIVWGEHPDWESVEEHPTGNGRCEGVFKHVPTQRHYRLTWRTGATEMQERDPFEHLDPDPVEVEKIQVTVSQWHPVWSQ